MKFAQQLASILSRAVRWRLFMAVLVMGACPYISASEHDDYLRGYVDALLDSRYPGLGLRVQAVKPDAGVTLTSRTCLGPSQKRDVAYLLTQSGQVKTVLWALSTDCDKSHSAPESDAAVPAPIDIHALPETELFAPLLADPRQPRFSVSYQHYRGNGRDFAAASTAVGEYFGLASGMFGEYGSSQVGIQGAVFALFNLDAPSSDLINADYWIGLPISYRRGPWSYLIRLYHQSSHLGDEFILGNPGVNRVNLSYEELEGLVSYEWEQWRIYGGGGYLVHSEPELAPKQVHAGAEYILPRAAGKFDLIAAADVRASEELGWGSSRSYQVGFEFKSSSPRRVRLMLEHFRGHSPNGQFYREPLRYTGLGLYFGF
ncbi:DUF1207 domain-containing protein [Sulfuricaulis sp.]|uniref:DUF1207 domain-containing protein n=1 Tax=Sulfuricaulis sp. TaxID=2003553 RepID=UPI00355A0B3F